MKTNKLSITPGPWKVTAYSYRPTPASPRQTVYQILNGPDICNDPNNEVPENEKAIASLPDLLAEVERLRESNKALREALKELAYWSDRVNSLQHAGLEILPSSWSELWNVTNKAKAALAR